MKFAAEKKMLVETVDDSSLVHAICDTFNIQALKKSPAAVKRALQNINTIFAPAVDQSGSQPDAVTESNLASEAVRAATASGPTLLRKGILGRSRLPHMLVVVGAAGL